jgi:hypothetical protein
MGKHNVHVNGLSKEWQLFSPTLLVEVGTHTMGT